MPKTTTTRTIKSGDITAKITITDSHNMSARKRGQKSTKSTRAKKSSTRTKKRRKSSSKRRTGGERMFYDD